MSEVKLTNSGWPDLLEWAEGLIADLDKRGADYVEVTAARAKNPGSYTDDGVPIEAACTVQASAVLSAVAKALHSLPPMRGHPATAALNDLVIALHELAAGGSPVLLKRAEKALPGDQMGHEAFVGYVALSTRFFREGCGFSDQQARQAVAAVLAKHDIRGRKGAPVTASTLQDWQDVYGGLPPDHPVRDAIEKHWLNWTTTPGWLEAVTKADAISYIEALAATPAFMNKARIAPAR